MKKSKLFKMRNLVLLFILGTNTVLFQNCSGYNAAVGLNDLNGLAERGDGIAVTNPPSITTEDQNGVVTVISPNNLSDTSGVSPESQADVPNMVAEVTSAPLQQEPSSEPQQEPSSQPQQEPRESLSSIQNSPVLTSEVSSPLNNQELNSPLEVTTVAVAPSDKVPAEPLPAIDNRCSASIDPKKAYLPPWWERPSLEKDLQCDTGFELWNGATQDFTIQSNLPAGTVSDRIVELDFATYRAPNALTVYGTRKDGSRYLIFDSCLMSTSPYAEGKALGLSPHPVINGKKRPVEESIRYFQLRIEAGTVALSFHQKGNTPFYIRMNQLCEFGASMKPKGAKGKFLGF